MRRRSPRTLRSIILGALASAIAIIIPAHSSGEIPICALLALSGPGSLADSSKSVGLGIKDCIAIANTEGGINGKKIRYIESDDGYREDLALKLFNQSMQEHKPLCFFGSGTPAALSVASELKERHSVLYTSTSFSAQLIAKSIPGLFVPGPTYGDQFRILLQFIAREKKGASVAFFYTRGPLGEDPIKYGRSLARRLGLTLVGEVAGDIRGGEHSQQIRELIALKPDFVILHGWIGPANAAVIKQCKDLGLNSEIAVTIWGTMKSVVDELGSNSLSFYGVSPFAFWWMDDVPMVRKIKQYTSENYPDVKYRPETYMMGFCSGLIFIDCLRRAAKSGQLNPDGIVAALRSTNQLDTGGLTPELTFVNQRFPVAWVVRSNQRDGVFERLWKSDRFKVTE